MDMGDYMDKTCRHAVPGRVHGGWALFRMGRYCRLLRYVIVLSAANTCLLICAVRPMCRGAGSTAPSRPQNTLCHARDPAHARDLLCLRGTQREENKFEIEVRCLST